MGFHDWAGWTAFGGILTAFGVLFSLNQQVLAELKSIAHQTQQSLVELKSIAHQTQQTSAALNDIAGLLRDIQSASPGPLPVSISEGGNPQRVELVKPEGFAVVLPAQFWAVSGRIARERAGLQPRGPRRRLRRSPGAVRSSQASNPGAPATPDVAAG
ncbi:hypothetical protein FALBO_8418 [Fusarium albosuccineum]|uniref:Uncharacterized protein n=1 Tax=Fusarium albosuccineum TaxID=1237068 RepID=A0A8H4LAX7_9HYPO|nr:hypothetical protein FALBO_8418 [Fusarium albosuccineum]